MNLKERSKTGNIRGLYKRNIEFKGQLPITNLVINKKNNLFADPNSGLKRWKKKCFSVSLNVHGVNDARQTEMHTAEPLVPEPSALRLWRFSESWKVTNHRILIKFQ